MRHSMRPIGNENRTCGENPRLGGTCLSVGCIPSKALLHSTEIYHEVKDGGSAHGIVADGISHDLSALMKRKDAVVDQLGKGVKGLVSKKGVTVLSGTARLLGEGQVEVSGAEAKQLVTAKEIILATGSKPVELPFLALLTASKSSIAITPLPLTRPLRK